jgi:hypothetical protein
MSTGDHRCHSVPMSDGHILETRSAGPLLLGAVQVKETCRPAREARRGAGWRRRARLGVRAAGAPSALLPPGHGQPRRRRLRGPGSCCLSRVRRIPPRPPRDFLSFFLSFLNYDAPGLSPSLFTKRRVAPGGQGRAPRGGRRARGWLSDAGGGGAAGLRRPGRRQRRRGGPRARGPERRAARGAQALGPHRARPPHPGARARARCGAQSLVGGAVPTGPGSPAAARPGWGSRGSTRAERTARPAAALSPPAPGGGAPAARGGGTAGSGRQHARGPRFAKTASGAPAIATVPGESASGGGGGGVAFKICLFFKSPTLSE